jgi:hypothetical protein
MLSGTSPSGFAGLVGNASSEKLNRVLRYYVPIPKSDEENIWKVMRARQQDIHSTFASIPEDELVEDAGLAEAA